MEATETGHVLRAQRLENLEGLKQLGFTPFGRRFDRTGRLSDIRASFEEGKTVQAAGRLMTKREMGKSVFAHIQDGAEQFQIYVKRDTVTEAEWAGIKLLDIGDHLGVEGELFVTHKGEQTIKIHRWVLLSKALLPLPDKYHGLQDTETRFRQRYLDLVANPDVRKRFNQRSEVLRALRAFLDTRGYQEVETPMMQPLAGGAAATPFQTRYHALSVDMFLRIAPELYLKRLLVGGFDKVFELNRNFRNEGLSRQHNPEFTMLEIYEAYGNMDTMKQLVQDMITHLAETVFGTLQVGTEAEPVDLSRWRTVPYRELIEETAGADYYSLCFEEQKARAVELGCDLAPEWDAVEVTQEIFEKKIERTLINPTFVTRLPARLVPLAKACEDDPEVVDVFELIIGGREIAPGYNELNDPIEQRRRLEAQAGGDPAKMDQDFLTALEHGMPPAGGMGVGIDRLIMLLTGAEAIRDVILFPQLKPRES